jgi:hypothetical protein
VEDVGEARGRHGRRRSEHAVPFSVFKESPMRDRSDIYWKATSVLGESSVVCLASALAREAPGDVLADLVKDANPTRRGLLTRAAWNGRVGGQRHGET